MRTCTHTVYSGYAVMCQHNAAAEKQGCLNTFEGAGPRWPWRGGEGGVRTKDDVDTLLFGGRSCNKDAPYLTSECRQHRPCLQGGHPQSSLVDAALIVEHSTFGLFSDYIRGGTSVCLLPHESPCRATKTIFSNIWYIYFLFLFSD